MGSIPEERSPTETPTSPIRTSFRVGKVSSGAKLNGRKQSFDPANLSRVDPTSVNFVVPAGVGLGPNSMSMATNGTAAHISPSSIPPGFNPGVAFISSSGAAFPSPEDLIYGTPLPYDMGLQFPQAHTAPIQGVKAEEVLSPGRLTTDMPPPPYANGVKHSRSPSLNGAGLLGELGPSPMPKPNGTADSTRGSCCGDNNETSSTPAAQGVYEKPFLPQYQSPVEMKPPTVDTSFHFQTTFTYPAQYGSWQQPMNPEIWQQIISQPGISLDIPLPTTPTNGTPVLGTSHECGCGEGCQCVGCLAHPFNDQMFQYVNNAYTESNGSRSGSRGNCCGGGDLGVDAVQAQGPAPESPPEAHTPSDGSGIGEEQSLPTVDYFFVNIPMRMDGSCGGNIQSCPCGDDCECIGCLVHNTPLVPEH